MPTALLTLSRNDMQCHYRTSSRAHAILTVDVEQVFDAGGGGGGGGGGGVSGGVGGDVLVRRSRLLLVDLAGSERVNSALSHEATRTSSSLSSHTSKSRRLQPGGECVFCVVFFYVFVCVLCLGICLHTACSLSPHVDNKPFIAFSFSFCNQAAARRLRRVCKSWCTSMRHCHRSVR
jgi:hypothetical protein